MKRINRWIALLLFAAMLIPLAGCGPKEEGQGGQNGGNGGNGGGTQPVNGMVYRPEFIDVVGQDGSMYLMGMHGDTLYVTYDQYDEKTYDSVTGFGSVNTDGTGFTSFWSYTSNWQAFEESGGYAQQHVSAYAVDGQGNLIAVINAYSSYEDEDGEWVAEDAYTLYRYDSQGNEMNELSLEFLSAREDEYFYISQILPLSDGRLLLLNYESVVVLNDQLELEKRFENLNLENLLVTGDGQLIARVWDQETYEVGSRLFNLETGELEGEGNILPESIGYNTVVPGEQYDFYSSNGTGVYGVNVGDEEGVLLFNWLDMDMVSSYAEFRVNDKGEFYCLDGKFDESSPNTIVKLSQVDASSVPEKKEMTYGCLYLDYDLKRKIVEYNRKNSEYRINVKEYMDWNSDTSYQDAITRLNTDIISGNIPDMLDLSELSYETYAQRGFLADIDKLIDQDSELKQEDFVQSVFDVMRVDGKLYTITTSYGIRTLIGPTDLVGEGFSWSMEDFKNKVAALPEGATAFGEYMTQDEFIYSMIGYNLSQFIDRKTGKCSFDSQTFMDYLEYASALPEEYDWEAYDQIFDEEYIYENPYLNGKVMLMSAHISDPSDLANYRSQFGRDISLIGYPNEDNSVGSVLYPYTIMGISAKSEYQEEAWSFLRTLLTQNYQRQYSYGLPTNRAMMEERIAQAMEGTGNGAVRDMLYPEVDGEQIKMTQEDVDMLWAIIEAIEKLQLSNDSVTEIVQQELLAYFAGDKSVEETAKVIQSKVQTYIDESR